MRYHRVCSHSSFRLSFLFLMTELSKGSTSSEATARPLPLVYSSPQSRFITSVLEVPANFRMCVRFPVLHGLSIVRNPLERTFFWKRRWSHHSLWPFKAWHVSVDKSWLERRHLRSRSRRTPCTGSREGVGPLEG
ncbi:hypothetical protein BT69DRAFT_662194 [Atractiella rhizophila]|nr:hypothetical protein BT69DRAFT_662194 [Atractiella rhizophila]